MTTPHLPKVYIYAAGHWPVTGDVMVFAVTEDGEGLAEHVCSSMAYARRDLHDHGYRHPLYAARFGGWGDGEFYDLVVVPLGGSPPAEVMEAIRRRNEAIAAAPGEPVASAPDPDGQTLYTFTIYHGAADCGDGYAVRQFQVRTARADPGPLLGVRPTLDEARDLVPAFADTRLPRSEHDAPTVVETWC